MSFSPVAKSVLDGTYDFPPDFDQSTRELVEECAHIRQTVPPNSVSDEISTAQWQYKWRGAKEKTSSSESGLHYGHYKKAGSRSEKVSAFHALKATLALRRGIALARWSRADKCLAVAW